MAATEVIGQICDGPVTKKYPEGMFLLYTKPHAFIIKWTIFHQSAWL